MSNNDKGNRNKKRSASAWSNNSWNYSGKHSLVWNDLVTDSNSSNL